MNQASKSKNQLRVQAFMLRMRSDMQGCALSPSIPAPETRVLRAKLLLEETLETIEAMGIQLDLPDAFTALKIKDIEFKPVLPVNIVEVADGLCDVDVVKDGAAEAFGISLQPLLSIVHDDNDKKFLPGHKFVNGKLIKPPDHKGCTAEIGRELLRQGCEVADVKDNPAFQEELKPAKWS